MRTPWRRCGDALWPSSRRILKAWSTAEMRTLLGPTKELSRHVSGHAQDGLLSGWGGGVLCGCASGHDHP